MEKGLGSTDFSSGWMEPTGEIKISEFSQNSGTLICNALFFFFGSLLWTGMMQIAINYFCVSWK